MKRAWQLAKVIDPDLPFCGRFVWVRGPVEILEADGWTTPTLRTSMRIGGRAIYIRLKSIELQAVGSNWTNYIEAARARHQAPVDSEHRRYDAYYTSFDPSRLRRGFARDPDRKLRKAADLGSTDNERRPLC